jgi:hypothetical protein
MDNPIGRAREMPFRKLVLVLLLVSTTLANGDTMQMQLEPNWEYVADTVMGGVSKGSISQEAVQGTVAVVLRGDVSLDNNGGFIQMAFDLRPDSTTVDVSHWHGLDLTVWGNDQIYDIRMRTGQLTRPWQSFRTDFATLSKWQTLRLPFDKFEAHKNDEIFDPTQLRRIGILAIGREFEAHVAVSSIKLYRDE